MRTIAPTALQQQLLSRFVSARQETDQLFGILSPDALYDRPIPERHRIAFYIGHLEAFDWNLLRDALGLKSFHPAFDHLFAFGIDPVDGGLPTDSPADWPSMPEIEGYRKQIRGVIDSAIAEWPDDPAITQLMNIAIEHRLMHAETLEYMFHQLSFDRKIQPISQEPTELAPVIPEMIRVPAGRATLGLSRGSNEFGWDNEFEEHTVEVPSFAIDKYKVSNGQFAQFVADGGYDEPAYWSEADWTWRAKDKIWHPVFWVPNGNGWNYRTMFDEIPLPMDWPVYVSHAEANAYARWAGKALPSESEWHRAAYGTATGDEGQYPWGDEPPTQDRQEWNPTAVGQSPNLQSAFGLDDLLGTGWEWTATQFAPFPGFEIIPAYPGYSANFFDGKHYVMKGGSTRTAACMLRRSFRNWFQPHYQYVYAGFRCITR